MTSVEPRADTERQQQMSAKLTAAEQRERVHELTGVVNSYDLIRAYAEATGTEVLPYIAYRRQVTGRGYKSAAWQIHRPGFKTDDGPNPHWRDYGNKTFNVFSRDQKQPQLEAAKAWVAERYGITEWAPTAKARTTSGDVFPAQVVEWFHAEIKRKLAERSAP